MQPRGESNANKKSKDKQCVIVMDLLVEGKTGVDLEDTVKKWENKNKAEVGGGQSEGDPGKGKHKTEDTIEDACTHARSQMPDAVNTWFKIPLTAMFKWSLSVPASQSLPEDLQQHLPPSHAQTHQVLLGSTFANISYNIYDTPLTSYKDITNSSGDGTGHQHAGATLDSISNLLLLVLPSLLEGSPAWWNNISPCSSSDIDY